jgi:hypothetical protein
MLRQPRILGPEAPALRVWISFNPEELTKEKTGLPEDLCPLPDTELYPYRRRLIDQAEASDRNIILIYDSHNLTEFQRLQMEDVADLSVGLYMVDYHRLKELKNDDDDPALSLQNFLEDVEEYWRLYKNEGSLERGGFRGDYIDAVRLIALYDCNEVINHVNQKYEAQVPVEKGMVAMDLDMQPSALKTKLDELTPGLVPFSVGRDGRYENGLLGVTEPRNAQLKK